MDNAPIHTSIEINKLIESRERDYKCVYLPPYSPELNPIEQFWALIKARVKRQKLQDTETLEARIVDAVYNIPTKYLHNIALHSKNHFENCLNKKPI